MFPYLAPVQTTEKLAAIRRIMNLEGTDAGVQAALDRLSPPEVFWLENDPDLLDRFYLIHCMTDRELTEEVNEKGGSEIYVSHWPDTEHGQLIDTPYIGFDAALKDLPKSLRDKTLVEGVFEDDVRIFAKEATAILIRRLRLEIWKRVIQSKRRAVNRGIPHGHFGTCL